MTTCDMASGNPQRDREWNSLIACIDDGKPVKKPSYRRLIHQADRFLHAQFYLWVAVGAWYDAVVSDLDETDARAHLLATIRKYMEDGRI